MVHIPQDHPVAEGGMLDTLAETAMGLAQGLLDVAAFAVVAGLLWTQLPPDSSKASAPGPVATIACEADCIATSALGAGSGS